MQVRFALPLALLAGALAACSQSQPPATQSPDTASAASTPADAPAPADATPAQDASAPAPDAGAAQPASVAGSCSTEVDANDNMQYSTKAIDIPASCTDYAITLKHTGTMPIAAMGHNLVIAKTSDMQGIADDGAGASIEDSHIKPGDARVIAFAKMVGGGQSSSVTVPVAKLKDGGPFSFFCTFPGHLGMMQGTIAVK